MKQQVRIVGQLEGIDASNCRFLLRFDTREAVEGSFAPELTATMHSLCGKRVLVFGTVVYHESGELPAVELRSASETIADPSFFSRLPPSPCAHLDVKSLHSRQGPRSGMAAIMDQWPGDESDAEINDALERLS